MNDLRICFENRLALKVAGFLSKFAFRIHWCHNRQTIAQTYFVIFLAVAGSDMYAAGSLVLRDKVTKNNFRIAIDPGMTANDAFELGAGPCAPLV